VQYNGQAYAAWGLGPRPLYAYRLSAGRWFTAADGGATGIPAMILGPVVADTSGARVGQVITLDMAAGPVEARVIGIDTGQNNGGSIVCGRVPSVGAAVVSRTAQPCFETAPFPSCHIS
jgi:hypothetical protein